MAELQDTALTAAGSRIASGVNDAPSAASDTILRQKKLKETIGLARAATERREWQEAALLWQQVLEQSPGHAPAYVGAGNALRESGQYEAAEQILSVAAAAFPDHVHIALARGWTANARRDWPAAIGRWEDVCTRFPHQRQLYRGMAQALREANRADELNMFLLAAQARLAPEIAIADAGQKLDALFEIARLRADWPRVRNCAEQILARDGEANASVAAGALCQALWHLGEYQAAEAAALHALSADPGLMEALVILSRAATERGDGESVLSCYQKIAALKPNVPHWPFKRIELLNWLGRVDELLRETQALLERWPDNAMLPIYLRHCGPAAALAPVPVTPGQPADTYDPDARQQAELQLLFERAPSVLPGSRTGIVEDFGADLIIAGPPGPDTAILVFAGSGDDVSIPFPIFDCYLVPLAVTPIYLRDFNRLRYMTGIRSLGGGYQQTIDWLRRVLRDRGVTRVCTLGNCVGGFGAIRYGIDLDAACIVTMNTPTYCPADEVRTTGQDTLFMRKRLLSELPADLADMKLFMQSRSTNARIEVFYDDDKAPDRGHAERLGDIPGVRLHPGPGREDRKLLRGIALTNDNFCQWLADLFAIEIQPAGLP